MCRLLIVICVLATMKTVNADWINLTGAEIAPNIAEIHVYDDQVKIKLEVFVGDIEKFDTLIPDEWMANLDIDRPSLSQRQQQFSNHGLKIMTGEGEALAAKFSVVEPRMRVDRRSPFAGKINPYNLRKLPKAPDDKRVLYAEITYPFEKKPERLVIVPPQDENGVNRVTLGFIAYHQNVPVTDFRFLGRAETLELNWQDPWYTRFENKNLTRHHRYPIMLFLYAEPRRIRQESLMRIDDLVAMLGFNRDQAADATGFRELVIEKMLAFHDTHKPLRIDGTAHAPDRIRIEYLNAGLSGLTVVENNAKLDDASLLVGVILEYFIPALPDQVEFDWQYFNQNFERIPVTVTDPVGPLSNFIDREDSIISWQNFLKQYQDPVPRSVQVQTGWNLDLPYFGTVNILSQLPDEQQAQAIVEGVLDNLRIAFVEKQPTGFERLLEQVTTTRNPEQLGTELSKLFSPEVSGSINGEVHGFNGLEVTGIRALDHSNAFAGTVSGTADIRAQHWGHMDQRLVNFQLLLDLVEVDGHWRLTDATVIDLKRTN